MTQDEQRLAELRAKMSEKQRREMAEIVQNEMKRRGLSHDDAPAATMKKPEKSSSLNRDQVGELYSELNDAVKQLRLKKLEEQVSQKKKALGMKQPSSGLLSKFSRHQPKPARAAAPMPEPVESFDSGRGEYRNAPLHPHSDEGSDFSLSKIILMGGVVSFGVLKMAFVSGVVDGASEKFQVKTPAVASPVEPAVAAPKESAVKDVIAPPRAEAPIAAVSLPDATVSDRQILFELDSRRVELEQRKEALDRREQDLKAQTNALSERLAELRSLTTKLSEARKERDQRYETRMEQLGNVYGAMNPNESAVLIGRLEDDTAIALLQRMPEKRMGQILSFMERERAVELTRILTDRNAMK